MIRPSLVLVSLGLLAACSDDATRPVAAPASSSTPSGVEPPGCERGASLEADFTPLSPTWMVPSGGSPATLPEPGPGGYVVATTRLNLRAEAQELFLQHTGAILQEIMSQPGFVGLQVGSSESCGVARTLSVWQDEEALYAFVTGNAHRAAMSETSKMSRGLSNTTHFTATRSAEISWAAAAQAISADDGPFY